MMNVVLQCCLLLIAIGHLTWFCFLLGMKGDLILQFEPQPPPAPSDRSQDNELDISLEQESACDTQQESACDTQQESACDTQQESGQMMAEEVPSESESRAFKLYI